jgi:hypothetical protein
MKQGIGVITNTKQLLVFLVFLILGGVLQGCAKATSVPLNTSSSIQTKCSLPSDQSGTLSGRWPLTPIPIAMTCTDSFGVCGSNSFTDAESAAVLNAANTWNSFYTQSKGFSLLNYGSAASPKIKLASSSAHDCSGYQSVFNGNAYVTDGAVVIEKVTSGWSGSSDEIAVTGTCYRAEDPEVFQYAFMLLNYENFFVAGTQQPDLQSIITHELGHLIGLDHSCTSGGGAGFPNCNSATLKSVYRSAVMFPSFRFSGNTGEVKRSINSNDQGRANCLY